MDASKTTTRSEVRNSTKNTHTHTHTSPFSLSQELCWFIYWARHVAAGKSVNELFKTKAFTLCGVATTGRDPSPFGRLSWMENGNSWESFAFILYLFSYGFSIMNRSWRGAKRFANSCYWCGGWAFGNFWDLFGSHPCAEQRFVESKLRWSFEYYIFEILLYREW